MNINRLILLLLCLATALSFGVKYIYEHNPDGGTKTAVIYKNGRVYQRINLAGAAAGEFIVNGPDGHYNIVEVRDGQIRVRASDCPHQICVNTGWLSRPGQMSVCLPNRLKVVVEGSTEKALQVDGVAH